MDGINKTPGTIKNILSAADFEKLSSYFKNHQVLQNIGTDEFGRKLIGDKTDLILKEYSQTLLPIARSYFNTSTCLPSYSLFAEYSANNISLYKHKDANACTYTIDLVLYQSRPWAIYVNGVEFLAEENEGVLFMGEDQEHWRETILDNSDKIGVVFFHYVEPNHWWFKEGPEYVDIIRKRMMGEM